MKDENTIVKDTELFLDERGMNLSQLVITLGKHNSTVLQLDDEHHQAYCKIYTKIEKKNYKDKDKGKLLEELTYILFHNGYPGLLECRRNCRTSTNEIDLLINWTEEARMAGINNAFSCLGDIFLCECKNYEGKVDVTYVGKFCYLLRVCNSTVGIMIAWEGITARGSWSDAKGLIKKNVLKDEKYIIVIDKQDLKRIYERKTNIFSIIYDKYISLKNEIDYDKYIVKHEAEDLL